MTGSLSDELDSVDMTGVLQGLAGRCADLLGLASGAVVAAGRGDELTIVAASDEPTRLLAAFAVEHGQGPCVDCHRTGVARTGIDLGHPAAAARWPHFTARARRTGFAVAHTLPLRPPGRGAAVGALTLFQRGPGRLAPDGVALAQALAALAAVAVVQERALERGRVERDQLRAALTSRIVIEQAKGILAERWRIQVDEAFAVLRDYARTHGLRIAVLARGVISGEVDTEVMWSAGRARRP
ncbi:ANTAR domain-containing protein [Streptomyces sp. NPDC020719]|uniref:ANTAR domain-containing protein n=1 Tax=unclassified Streptomyces TaxID=2593676 RepID=UPI0033FE8893